MPNIKSAKKRVKVIEKKTLRNNMIKSGYKSAVKKCSYGLSKIKIMHIFYLENPNISWGFFVIYFHCSLFLLMLLFV